MFFIFGTTPGETLKIMQLGLPESARVSASSVVVRVDVVERRGLDVLSSKFNVGLRGMMMMMNEQLVGELVD